MVNSQFTAFMTPCGFSFYLKVSTAYPTLFWNIVTAPDTAPLFSTKHTVYKFLFFTSRTIEWNNLDQELKNNETHKLLRSNIAIFIRPSPNSFFNCRNIKPIQFVTRLRLDLSHLLEHKSKFSFQEL